MEVNELVAKFGDVKRQPKESKTMSQAEKLRKNRRHIFWAESSFRRSRRNRR